MKSTGKKYVPVAAKHSLEPTLYRYRYAREMVRWNGALKTQLLCLYICLWKYNHWEIHDKYHRTDRILNIYIYIYKYVIYIYMYMYMYVCIHVPERDPVELFVACNTFVCSARLLSFVLRLAITPYYRLFMPRFFVGYYRLLSHLRHLSQ